MKTDVRNAGKDIPLDEASIEGSWFAEDAAIFFRRFLLTLITMGLFFAVLTSLQRGFDYVSSIVPVLMALALIGLIFLHLGKTRWAVIWMLSSAWLAISVWPYVIIGVRSPLLYGYPVFIMLSGWLIGRQAAVIVGVLSSINLGLMYWGEVSSLLQFSLTRDSFHYFHAMVATTVLSTLLSVFISGGFRKQIQSQVQLNSELQQQMQALQNSEERFARLFNQNPLPCLVIRIADGHLLEANHAWERAFGWERQQVLGKSLEEIGCRIFMGDDSGAGMPLFMEGAFDAYPLLLRNKAGEVRSYLASGEVSDVEGERRLLLTMLDQTRRLQVEAELKNLNVTLEARVQERTAELSAMLQSLQQTQEELVHSEKMASLGSLVAGISHDLNTPIGNTMTVASTLQDRVREFNLLLAKGDLKKSALLDFLRSAEEMSDLLVRSCRRSTELISSFKQVAIDQASERRRKFDLRAVVEDVLVTLRPTIKHQPWVLESEVPAGMGCDSYPGPLGQVLTNLIQNACVHGFGDRGHGRVSIAAATPMAGWVRLTVSDDGVGMDGTTLARVFDPFFTTRLGQGGSGLGTSIAYRIVTSILGGAISVDSELGKGSCFTLIFPMTAPQPI